MATTYNVLTEQTTQFRLRTYEVVADSQEDAEAMVLAGKVAVKEEDVLDAHNATEKIVIVSYDFGEAITL